MGKLSRWMQLPLDALGCTSRHPSAIASISAHPHLFYLSSSSIVYYASDDTLPCYPSLLSLSTKGPFFISHSFDIIPNIETVIENDIEKHCCQPPPSKSIGIITLALIRSDFYLVYFHLTMMMMIVIVIYTSFTIKNNKAKVKYFYAWLRLMKGCSKENDNFNFIISLKIWLFYPRE